MIFLIANQELRSLLREGLFHTTALLLSGLFLLSLFGAYDYYTSRLQGQTWPFFDLKQ
jgi:hypothetical protein